MSQAEEVTETLREHIERRIAEQIAADQTFLNKLMAAPDAVIKPLITEVLGDDGEIDLSDYTTSIHLQSPRHLHFVVPLPGDDDEVAGFDVASTLGAIDLTSTVGGDALFGKRSRRCVSDLCSRSDLGCPTVYTDTSACPKW